MEVRALITQLLEMPMDAQVRAIDQFGTSGFVTGVRAVEDRVSLDFQVEEDEDEGPADPVATRAEPW